MYLVIKLVAFYPNNTFLYDPNIFTKGYTCHYVELMFFNNTYSLAVKFEFNLPISASKNLKN